MKKVIKIILLVTILVTQYVHIVAQPMSHIFGAAGSPANPKVQIAWNRYYDAEAIGELCHRIAKAYPGLVHVKSIGKSFQGKTIWSLIITDFSTGVQSAKPGIYVQGNLHGNEIQGSECALYIAWYLTESFQHSTIIKDLLKNKVFYIVPTVNPDSRDYFMHHATNASEPRGNMEPMDRDKDGKKNEDPSDDLDGDGSITQMRIKDSVRRVTIDSAQIIRVGYSEQSDMIEIIQDVKGKRIIYDSVVNGNTYALIAEGSIDNDHDGKADEDGVQLVEDPNRFWFSSLPKHEIPEKKVIKEFFVRHPNITVAVSLHNALGMIGNSMGYAMDTLSLAKDNKIYENIGLFAKKVMPGYRYERSGDLPGMRIDTNEEASTEICWFSSHRGAYSFLVELMSYYDMYNFDYGKTRPYDSVGLDMRSFCKDMLFDEPFVPWHPYDHPTLGKVEIGGV